MLLRNFTFHLSNVFKRRLFCAAGVFSPVTKAEIIIPSKTSYNNTSLQILSLLHKTSIKEFLDVGEISQLDQFFRPVEDLKNPYIFALDETVAKDIVSKILSKAEKNKEIVIEANPGLGLITINLINSGVQHVFLLENSSLYNLSLRQILLRHINTVTKHTIIYQKQPYQEFILKLFDLTQKHSSGIKFVGIFTSFYFLRLLVLNFIKNRLWDEEFEMYLVLNNEIYQSLKAFTPKHLKYVQYCILNLFFRIGDLAIYPRSAFLPVSNKNNENMYLIRITRNSDFIKTFNSTELKEYLIFITILGGKKNLVIQTLEKWLPNCGPYLISKGISMTNETQDFSPQDSFNLFKVFRQCEGYDDFKNCVLDFFPESIKECICK